MEKDSHRQQKRDSSRKSKDFAMYTKKTIRIKEAQIEKKIASCSCEVLHECRVTTKMNQMSQCDAEIADAPDNSEPEVQSKLDIIAQMNPQLAQCAAIVNDPEQTAALADFAQGKLSYAEMRALCG